MSQNARKVFGKENRAQLQGARWVARNDDPLINRSKASFEAQEVQVVTDMDSQGSRRNISTNIEPQFPKIVTDTRDERIVDSNSETEGVRIVTAINDNSFPIGRQIISGSHLKSNSEAEHQASGSSTVAEAANVSCCYLINSV